MRRREFIALASCAVFVRPHSADAQQMVARIGYLGLGYAPVLHMPRIEALRAGLRDLGYVEGKNLVIEFRWAETVDQLPQFARELVRMNVNVIFAPSSTQVESARQVTETIPIVFANHADPVGTGANS